MSKIKLLKTTQKHLVFKVNEPDNRYKFLILNKTVFEPNIPQNLRENK